MTVGPFESAPRPFSRVMVANRGEIAVRILKAAREAGLGSVMSRSRTRPSTSPANLSPIPI